MFNCDTGHRGSRAHGFTLIEMLIVVAIIGIIAAVAIPSLLRARISANESATIGDIRTIITAEATYHSANGGNYGMLTCLSTPSACIAGYAATAPTLLDVNIASLTTKHGFVRNAFYIGTGPNVGDVQSYCYQGRPIVLNRTGTRSLGGDAAGAVAAGFGDFDCCQAVGVLDTAACPLLK